MPRPFLASLLACLLACADAAAAAPLDRFGIRMLFPTRTNGRSWFAASWENGHARSFADAVDPMDPWLDAAHGSGNYMIDGHGTLTASGDYVRMYVHHPDRRTEWADDLEITAYVTRVSEMQRVSYSGPQIFARTNHGTWTGAFGGETQTLCDDRGLGAKVNLDGTWAFEKETRHGDARGYATAGAARIWASEFPRGVPVGIKYVLRNVANAQGFAVGVRLALYVDMTSGRSGGSWTKVTEFTDVGQWGVGYAACAPGASLAMLPIRWNLLKNSETKRPSLSVYFRHEYGVMRYQRLSVREINPG
jgi:hypothetical protein